MTESAFALTVPQEFFDQVVEATDKPFADSYLYGAELVGTKLTPRTRTGYRKMVDRYDFKKLLKHLGITLVEPPLWQDSAKRWPAKDARDFR